MRFFILIFLIFPVLLSMPAAAQTTEEIEALVQQVKGDLYTFADHVERCEPITQDFIANANGGTLERAVSGSVEDGCQYRFETVAAEPQELVCTVAAADQKDFADGYRAQADNIRPDGSLIEEFPQGTPPVITAVLSSEACTIVKS